MSLAPSLPVRRSAFNPLPLYIALFCLLWSFAFVAGKIGVTDCPPLILLTARFSLAGVLILGISAIRRDAWSLSWRDTLVFALLGVANNALYLGLGYTGLQTVSAGLGALIVSANPVFTAGAPPPPPRRGGAAPPGGGPPLPPPPRGPIPSVRPAAGRPPPLRHHRP